MIDQRQGKHRAYSIKRSRSRELTPKRNSYEVCFESYKPWLPRRGVADTLDYTLGRRRAPSLSVNRAELAPKHDVLLCYVSVLILQLGLLVVRAWNVGCGRAVVRLGRQPQVLS